MSREDHEQDFRLGRLRFIRLPPTAVTFSSKAESLPCKSSRPSFGRELPTDECVPAVDLGFGVTDDYGTDIDLFESIDLRLEIVSTSNGEPVDSLRLKLATDERSNPSQVEPWLDFTFNPSRGPFHGLGVKLVNTTARGQLPKRLSFRLTVAPPREPNNSSLACESMASRSVREIVNEPSQPVLETWNDMRYIFLAVESGDVELVSRVATKSASEKVQTTLRRIQFRDSDQTPITIVERPGLNNSTGQRLWDCAIGISAFFSLHPNALSDSTLPPVSDETHHASKRRKRSSSAGPSRIIELGAGCALASLVAERALRPLDREASIVATDIGATVETTLAENLDYNAKGSRVGKRVLDWGKLSDAQIREVLVGPPGSIPATVPTRVVLVATDVLYNPESHPLLLDTLLSFLRPSETAALYLEGDACRALIAYKRRTDGDDGFFDLAKKAGLKVEKVWTWSEVSVWSFE
ncbi:hypothetical protein JCM11491_006564 [Sporobolomyces phaffii]